MRFVVKGAISSILTLLLIWLIFTLFGLEFTKLSLAEALIITLFASSWGVIEEAVDELKEGI